MFVNWRKGSENGKICVIIEKKVLLCMQSIMNTNIGAWDLQLITRY